MHRKVQGGKPYLSSRLLKSIASARFIYMCLRDSSGAQKKPLIMSVHREVEPSGDERKYVTSHEFTI